MASSDRKQTITSSSRLFGRNSAGNSKDFERPPNSMSQDKILWKINEKNKANYSIL